MRGPPIHRGDQNFRQSPALRTLARAVRHRHQQNTNAARTEGENQLFAAGGIEQLNRELRIFSLEGMVHSLLRATAREEEMRRAPLQLLLTRTAGTRHLVAHELSK